MIKLGGPCRWRFAGAERGSRGSKRLLNRHYERVCAAEHALRGPLRLLERRLGLAEIVDKRKLGAVAVPFDVVVSKILPFAITLQRGASSVSVMISLSG